MYSDEIDALSANAATRNAQPDTKDGRGRTPLSYAAQKGHEDVVWLLLSRKDVDKNATDDSGYSPVQYAMKYNHRDIIPCLEPWSGFRYYADYGEAE